MGGDPIPERIAALLKPTEVGRRSCGISPPFDRLSPAQGHVSHLVLTSSPLYSGPEGPFHVRLACLIHAASVRSEPGSNSPIGKLVSLTLERFEAELCVRISYGNDAGLPRDSEHRDRTESLRPRGCPRELQDIQFVVFGHRLPGSRRPQKIQTQILCCSLFSFQRTDASLGAASRTKLVPPMERLPGFPAEGARYPAFRDRRSLCIPPRAVEWSPGAFTRATWAFQPGLNRTVLILHPEQVI